MQGLQKRALNEAIAKQHPRQRSPACARHTDAQTRDPTVPTNQQCNCPTRLFQVAHPKKYPYFYAKMMAERRAFEMEQEAAGRWSLVTLNPGVVWGPPIGASAARPGALGTAGGRGYA
jgi:hypothetical protein